MAAFEDLELKFICFFIDVRAFAPGPIVKLAALETRLSEVQTFVAVDLSDGVRGNLVRPANCVD